MKPKIQYIFHKIQSKRDIDGNVYNIVELTNTITGNVFRCYDEGDNFNFDSINGNNGGYFHTTILPKRKVLSMIDGCIISYNHEKLKDWIKYQHTL